MIPLSVPHLAGNEWKYVKDCIDTGWVSSAGAYVTQFEEMVAEFSSCKYGVATSNGTTGLHLAMHMLGITRGDYVIVPNITFIASANAVAYTGAESIFVDIDPQTWQMDLDLLEAFLQSKTVQRDGLTFYKDRPIKAVMPVHVLGNICDMDRLADLAKEYNLYIVEDATESLGSYRGGRHTGTWGIMSVFSFNGNKIITTGGGGVIVTNDAAHAKRAKHLSTQSKVNPDTYFHDEIGFNYRLVNILAALGVAQMEQLPSFIQKKKTIDTFYREQLSNLGDIRFQDVDPEVDPNCWLFTFYSRQQEALLEALQKNDIIARPFWTPMNQLPMFTQNVYITERDNARDIHKYCLSIPSSVDLTQQQMQKVADVIKAQY